MSDPHYTIHVSSKAPPSVRTRFAPSPTGFMHVGGVRTALYSWLFALKHGGEFVLRIEDTDKEREVEGAIGHIMESLKWLGIKWNESIDVGGPYGPYIQSERLDIYRAYAHKLLASGHAYPDERNEEEIAVLRAAAEDNKRPFLMREHRPETAAGRVEWDGKAPLRFNVAELKRMQWNDLIMGELSAGEEALDDFILIKGDGYPTYNFAHVVDDIEMRISHVVRGQEFISSTPKFLSLYEALKVVPPLFATLPPILGDGGTKKLSKRDGAKDLLDYRTDGYLPEAMMNFLALLGWHPSNKEEGNSEMLTREDLLREFDLTRVQKGGAQFDEQKLLFLNREWLRALSDADYLARGEFTLPQGADAETGMALLLRLIPVLKERAHTFGEARELVAGELAGLFTTSTASNLSREMLISKEAPIGSGSEAGIATKTHLTALVEQLQALPMTQDVDLIKAALMPYANTIPKEEGGRGSALWPLRYALSLAERSPDPFTLIAVLGTPEAVSRIQNALAILEK